MNQRPISLTLRLTLLFGAASAVVLLTFGWIIERSLEHHFSSGDINELKVIARSLEQSLTTLHSEAELARTKQRLDGQSSLRQSRTRFFNGTPAQRRTTISHTGAAVE